MTAAAKPGQCVGGGTPSCLVRKRVNVCLKRGVQLGLLLLPFVLEFLCAWLGLLE
jgi:hypothetical protein